MSTDASRASRPARAAARRRVWGAAIALTLLGGCGGGPSLAGWWKGPAISPGYPLSIGIGWQGDAMVFGTDGYQFNQGQLETTGTCGTDLVERSGRLTFVGANVDAAFGAAKDTATLHGSAVQLVWVADASLAQYMADAYKQVTPGADPNLSFTVTATFTGTLSGDTLNLDAKNTYENAATGKLVTSDTFSGLSLNRVATCPFTGGQP